MKHSVPHIVFNGFSGTPNRGGGSALLDPTTAGPMSQQPERPIKGGRTPGESAESARNVRTASLRGRDAEPSGDGKQPQPGESFLTGLMVHRHVDIAVLRMPRGRTWLWSDLHLSDRAVPAGGERPFRHTRELDLHLLRKWRRGVKPATRSSGWATSPGRTSGGTGGQCWTSGTAPGTAC